MDLYTQFLENPNNREDFLILEEELSTSESWKELLKLYETHIETDPDDKNKYIFKKVILLDEYMGETSKAIDLLVNIISKEEFNLTYLKYLEALCDTTKEFNKLVEAYRVILPKLDDEELKLLLSYKTASTLVKLENIEDSIIFIDSILDLDPDHEDSLNLLSFIANKYNNSTSLVEKLIPIYEKIEDWEGLLKLYNYILINEKKSKEKQLVILNKKIELLETVLSGDEELLFNSLLKAYSLDDSNLAYFEKLEYYTQILDYYDKLINNLILIYKESTVKLFLSYKIGIISYNILGNNEQAEEYLSYYSELLDSIDNYHEEAFNILFEILEEKENYQKLVVILEKQIIFLDDELKIEKYQNIARYEEEELENFKNAILAYKKMIELDPETLSYNFKLEELYFKLSDWENLLETIDVIILKVDDKEEYYKKKAFIYHDKLNNLEPAISLYKEMLSNYGYYDHDEVINRLIGIYKEKGMHSDLLTFYTEYKNYVEEEEELENLNYNIARLAAEQFQNYDMAYERLIEILNVNNAHEESIAMLIGFMKMGKKREESFEYLSSLFDITDDNENWIKLIQSKVNVSESDNEKANLFKKIAFIYNERLQEEEKAFPYYAKYFEFSKTTEAYFEFKEFYEAVTMYEEAVLSIKKVLQTEIEDLELRQILNFDISKLYYLNLENMEASEPYLNTVVKLDPSNLEALTMLNEIYTKIDDKDKLYDCLLKKVELEEDKIESYINLRDIAKEHKKDKEATLVFLGELYKIDEYSSMEHAEEKISLMKELNKYEELAIFYEELLQIDTEPRYIEDLADLNYKKLNNKVRAKDLYEQLIDISDDRIKILTNLENIYESENDNNDRLIEILEDKFEELKQSGDAEGTRNTIFKLGKLYLGYSKQYQRAKKMFSYLIKSDYKKDEIIKYLELYLNDSEALPFISEELAEFYKQKGEWYSLINLYKIESDLMEDEKENKFISIAELYQNELKNIDEAVKYYNESFKISQDIEIFKKIEEILLSAKNLNLLLNIYEEHLKDNIIEFDGFRVMLYVKIARLYQKFDKSIIAIKTLLHAHNEFSDNLKIMDVIIQVSKDAGDNDRAKDFYFKKLELIDDESEKVELIVEISRFIVEKYNDFAQAISILLEVLEWDPFNEKAIGIILNLNEYLDENSYDLKINIINKLKPIFIDNLQYDDMENLFNSIVNLKNIDLDIKIKLLREEIDFFFEVAQYEKGMEVYEKALNLSGGDSAIIKMGAGYAELGDDFSVLLNIYNSFLKKNKSLEKAIEIYLVMGDISYKYLGDLEKAEKYLSVILKKKEDYIEAYEVLANIYETEAEFKKLKGIYKKEIELLKDNNEKAKIYKKLALLLDENLYEPEEAIESYKQLVLLDPKDEEALDKLFEYYKDNGENEAILPILDNYLLIYPEDNLHLNRAAFFYFKNYKEKEDKSKLNKAMELSEKSYNLNKQDDKAQILLRETYKESNNFEKLISFYEERLSVSDDNDEIVDACVEVAGIYAENLNNLDIAQKYIEKIESIDPYNVRKLDIEEKILYAKENWQGLLELLENKLNLVDESQVDEVTFSKIKLLTEHFAEYEEALDDLKTIAINKPNNPEYLFYSEIIYTKLNNLKGYFDFIKDHVAETDDEDLKALILSKMGDIALNTFSKKELAQKCYLKALDILPTSKPAMEGLKNIALENNDFSTYADLLKKEMEYSKGDLKISIKEELIDIYINKLNEPEKIIPFKEEDYKKDESLENMIELINLYSDSSNEFDYYEYCDSFFDKLSTDRAFKERHIYMHKLGMAAYNFGDTDYAKKCFDKTNKLKMGYIPNQFSLAKLLMDSGDDAGALRAFQLLQLNHSKIESQKDKIELFLRLGRLRARNDDTLRAKSMYKKVLSLDPNNEEAKEYLNS